jgi:predicted transcriptional regulator
MMDEPKGEKSEVRAQLNRLAANLKATLAAARRSPQLRRLQNELEEGLHEVQTRLKEALDEVATSPPLQRVRQEAQELAERARAGELEGQMRRELVQLLERLNRALEETHQSWEAVPEQDTKGEDQGSG